MNTKAKTVSIYEWNAKDPLFAHNGLSIMNGPYMEFSQYLYAKSKADRKTAQELYEANLLYVAQRWDSQFIKGLV